MIIYDMNAIFLFFAADTPDPVDPAELDAAVFSKIAPSGWFYKSIIDVYESYLEWNEPAPWKVVAGGKGQKLP